MENLKMSRPRTGFAIGNRLVEFNCSRRFQAYRKNGLYRGQYWPEYIIQSERTNPVYITPKILKTMENMQAYPPYFFPISRG